MNVPDTILVAGALALLLLVAVVVVGSKRGKKSRATGIFTLSRPTQPGNATSAHPHLVAAAPVSWGHSPARFADDDQSPIGVARREFLNRSVLTLFAAGVAAFGSATLAFLWTESTGGFGSKINAGKLTRIKTSIAAGEGFHYVPAGKLWITEFPPSSLEEARTSYRSYAEVAPGLEAGVTALYQKCPHLGCRVPACTPSQWFECPCHGSKFNRVGEWKAGPAPRGLDRFPMTINNAGELIIDTSTIILGPSIGTNTTGQESEGPSCVASATGDV